MNKRMRSLHVLLHVICTVLISYFIVMPSVFVSAASWSPEDELRSYLLKNYPWEEIDISNVQLIGKISNELPERIIVEKGPLGRAAFSLILKNNKKIILKAHVRAFGRVVKSKRPFKKNHVIASEDIYLSKIDIRKMPGSSVKDPEKILGKSLKRSITVNIPIVEDMIEMSQVVARGESVVLLLSYKGMSIRTSGKTKEKGYVGMPVRAMNISSKKEVIGILVDNRTVKVVL